MKQQSFMLPLSKFILVALLLTTPTLAFGQAAAPITGFTNVTTALQPTGSGNRYDIGGGNNTGTELTAVPWQSLKPGDVVNIYYRATPYRNKILLSEQGTAANPIVINGVTNASGVRPTISAKDAVSINPEDWNSAYRTSLLLINKRNGSGTYGVNAKYYKIQNLRLADVRPSNSFTHNGVTESYLGFSRAIWSAGGQYITLQGMVIENNGSGIFVQANDDPGSLSKTWVIRGSKFENNGNHNRDHQIYLQSVSDPGEYNIVEGNYFGPPTPGQESIAQLKVRATGAVVRYNWFNSAHRTLDIVEAQDAIPSWMYENYTSQQILDYYRTSYVYGNVFVNDHSANAGQPAGRPLHFGADSFDEPPVFNESGPANGQPGMRGYQSPTYFFHNTFYMRASTSDMWRGGLFDLENNNSPGATSTPGEVDAWNNIIEFVGDTRIGAANRSGTVRFQGANLLYTAPLKIFAESDAYANFENSGDDPATAILYNGTIINQSANFVGANNTALTSKNFTLSSNSPARGKAVPLPAHLAAFPVHLQPAGVNGGATVRSSVADLGALESGGGGGGPPPNTAPFVTISTPTNGSSFGEDDSVSFTAVANDAQDGNISTNVSWSSDRDGGLGSGSSIATSSLSIGVHQITASVVDSGGLPGSSAIGVTITADTPPPPPPPPPTGGGPTLSGCPMFPADNIWNTPVDTLPVHQNSSAYIASMGSSTMHPDFGSGTWNGGPIGIPFVTVPGNQPKVGITFDYASESDPGPYPIPSNVPIEGGAASDGDRHIIMLDRDNCVLYEAFYAFPQQDGTWEAGSGAVFDLNSQNLRPSGWTSADAAGLPILHGLVRYDEVAAGEIKHAIRFTTSPTQQAFIWPARHLASSNSNPNLPPMGLRVRLKADFDMSGFSPQIQVILTAMKKYGLILADNGGDWYISGAPDERWDNDVLNQLKQISGSNFEAVDVSSLMIDANSGQALQSPSGGPACDVNSDGSMTVSDIQLSINQVLGIATCTADINADGQCTILDTQRVINSVLGLGCEVGS